MGIWFSLSAAWSAFDRWALRETLGLLSAAATAGMASLHVLAQGPLLGWGRRWNFPGRLKFYASGAFPTGVFVIFQIAVAAAAGRSSPPLARKAWRLSQGPGLLAWYALWWGALQKGRVDAATSLTPAGVHGMIIGAAWGWPPIAGPEWLWAAPLRVFAGWCLMFLPGALAAHERAPMLRTEGLWIRRAATCVTPAIAALIPAFFLALFMGGAHR